MSQNEICHIYFIHVGLAITAGKVNAIHFPLIYHTFLTYCCNAMQTVERYNLYNNI